MIIVEVIEEATGTLSDDQWNELEESDWDCYPEEGKAELVCNDAVEAFNSFADCTGFWAPTSMLFRFYVGKDQVN